MKSLDEVLEYKNEEVVVRFATEWKIDLATSNELFEEMKKWLWLCAKTGPGEMKAHPGLRMIDEMWHTFIVFTQEYSDFCNEYLGGYIHHKPVSLSEREEATQLFQSNPIEFKNQREVELTGICRKIKDNLGTETLLKWEHEIPELYNAQLKDLLKTRELDVSIMDKPDLGPLRSMDEDSLIRLLVHNEIGRTSIAAHWHSCGGYCSSGNTDPGTGP